MRNPLVLDKKYPYYVTYKTIYAWLLKTRLLAAVLTTVFLLTTDLKINDLRSPASEAEQSKRSALETVLNPVGANQNG